MSEWSHNFRPSYLRLLDAARACFRATPMDGGAEGGGGVEPAVAEPLCVLALTATATSATIASVCGSLGIPRDGVRTSDWYRANLLISVCRSDGGSARHTALVALLGRCATSRVHASQCTIGAHAGVTRTRGRSKEIMGSGGSGGGGGAAGAAAAPPAIVYVMLQKDADAVASWLAGSGIDAAAYHAGLSATERSRVQRRFMAGKVRVVVATVAFGMGLDKENVRAVVHFQMPKSIEDYVQQARARARERWGWELGSVCDAALTLAGVRAHGHVQIGRAGRDGKPALCHMFLCDEDFRRLHSLCHSDALTEGQIRGLLHGIFSPPVRELLAALSVGGGARGGDAPDGEADAHEAHEGAPSIDAPVSLDEASASLDLKGEVVETLLVYLEQMDQLALRRPCYRYAGVAFVRTTRAAVSALRVARLSGVPPCECAHARGRDAARRRASGATLLQGSLRWRARQRATHAVRRCTAWTSLRSPTAW